MTGTRVRATARQTIHMEETMASTLATRRLLLLCIPFFWSAIYIYNSYLSVYAESINPSLSLVGVIVATYGFTQLVLRIPVGVASDKMGRRKPFVMAGALFGALSCAALLIAPKSWVLVLGRGLAGVAAACWVPLTVLLVATYPQDQVIKATSMATALSATGMTVASAVGGAVAEATSLRVPFWLGSGWGWPLSRSSPPSASRATPRASGLHPRAGWRGAHPHRSGRLRFLPCSASTSPGP
jgi:MFS family permease